jgi:hypothetical protein
LDAPEGHPQAVRRDARPADNAGGIRHRTAVRHKWAVPNYPDTPAARAHRPNARGVRSRPVCGLAVPPVDDCPVPAGKRRLGDRHIRRDARDHNQCHPGRAASPREPGSHKHSHATNARRAVSSKRHRPSSMSGFKPSSSLSQTMRYIVYGVGVQLECRFPIKGGVCAEAQTPVVRRPSPLGSVESASRERRELPVQEKGRRNRSWVGTKWEQLLGSRVLPCPLVSPREVSDVQGFPAGNRDAGLIEALSPKE